MVRNSVDMLAKGSDSSRGNGTSSTGGIRDIGLIQLSDFVVDRFDTIVMDRMKLRNMRIMIHK
jgi:hypothetical protein